MYQAVAKLVLADDQSGKTQYYYEGSVVPWLSDADKKRFLAEGLVSELEFVEPGVEPDVDPQDPPAGDPPAGPAGKPERPAKTAAKSLWVDYAVFKGLDRDEAEKMDKADLIAALS